MAIPATYRGLINDFSSRTDEIKWYFTHFPKLLQEFPADVALAYLFSRIELGHNMALYCGLVKIHSANAEMARRAITIHHMTRENFKNLFRNVFGSPIIQGTLILLEQAESVRDKVMHGKDATYQEMRTAIYLTFDYATRLNALVFSIAGFKPFGRLQGFKGRGTSHNTTTTRWILKGIGLPLS
jgi:hypothetical protein